MSISSISSGFNTSTISIGSDSIVSQLEKQKADLAGEIQKENNSKDDAKTKQQKIQELQIELMQLEIQIAQQQAKQEAQKAEKQQGSSAQTENNTKEKEFNNPFGTIDIFA